MAVARSDGIQKGFPKQRANIIISNNIIIITSIPLGSQVMGDGLAPIPALRAHDTRGAVRQRRYYARQHGLRHGALRLREIMDDGTGSDAELILKFINQLTHRGGRPGRPESS